MRSDQVRSSRVTPSAADGATSSASPSELAVQEFQQAAASAPRIERIAAESGVDFITSAASLIFLAVVALLLVLPLVQTIVPVLGNTVPPLEERRQPAAFPSPALLLRANGDFASGLNAWFDDRAGFRDLFILCIFARIRSITACFIPLARSMSARTAGCSTAIPRISWEPSTRRR